jgi:hypothetical protein
MSSLLFVVASSGWPGRCRHDACKKSNSPKTQAHSVCMGDYVGRSQRSGTFWLARAGGVLFAGQHRNTFTTTCPETPLDSLSSNPTLLFPPLPLYAAFSFSPYISLYSILGSCFTNRPYHSFVCYPAYFLFKRHPPGPSSWPQRGCPLSSSRTARNDQICLDTLPHQLRLASPRLQRARGHNHRDLADCRKRIHFTRVHPRASSWILTSLVFKTSNNKLPTVMDPIYQYSLRRPSAALTRDPLRGTALDQTLRLAP